MTISVQTRNAMEQSAKNGMSNRLKRETRFSYLLLILLNNFILHLSTLYIDQIVTDVEDKKIETEQFTYLHP